MTPSPIGGMTPGPVPAFSPDERWCWRMLGGQGWSLYTTTNGARVVLMGDPGGRLVTRDDATGRLRPIEFNDPRARVLEHAPEVLQAAQSALEAWNRLYAHQCAGMPGAAVAEDDEFDAFLKLRAALSKARGEQ